MPVDDRGSLQRQPQGLVDILDKILELMPQLAAALAGLTFSEEIWELEDLKPQIEAIYLNIISETAKPYLWGAQRTQMRIVPASLGDLSQAIGRFFPSKSFCRNPEVRRPLRC